MGKVLVKCVQTPMQKYFYDRSLDSVVSVRSASNHSQQRLLRGEALSLTRENA